MSTSALPHQSVRLSSAGFKTLYEQVRADPAVARALADELEADPRGVVDRLFRLTKPQRDAIGATSEAELRRRAQRLLAELRAEQPGPLRFHPNGDAKPGGPYTMLSCTCLIR